MYTETDFEANMPKGQGKKGGLRPNENLPSSTRITKRTILKVNGTQLRLKYITDELCAEECDDEETAPQRVPIWPVPFHTHDVKGTEKMLTNQSLIRFIASLEQRTFVAEMTIEQWMSVSGFRELDTENRAAKYKNLRWNKCQVKRDLQPLARAMGLHSAFLRTFPAPLPKDSLHSYFGLGTTPRMWGQPHAQAKGFWGWGSIPTFPRERLVRFYETPAEEPFEAEVLGGNQEMEQVGEGANNRPRLLNGGNAQALAPNEGQQAAGENANGNRGQGANNGNVNNNVRQIENGENNNDEQQEGIGGNINGRQAAQGRRLNVNEQIERLQAEMFPEANMERVDDGDLHEWLDGIVQGEGGGNALANRPNNDANKQPGALKSASVIMNEIQNLEEDGEDWDQYKIAGVGKKSPAISIGGAGGDQALVEEQDKATVTEVLGPYGLSAMEDLAKLFETISAAQELAEEKQGAKSFQLQVKEDTAAGRELRHALKLSCMMAHVIADRIPNSNKISEVLHSLVPSLLQETGILIQGFITDQEIVSRGIYLLFPRYIKTVGSRLFKELNAVVEDRWEEWIKRSEQPRHTHSLYADLQSDEFAKASGLWSGIPKECMDVDGNTVAGEDSGGSSGSGVWVPNMQMQSANNAGMGGNGWQAAPFNMNMQNMIAQSMLQQQQTIAQTLGEELTKGKYISDKVWSETAKVENYCRVDITEFGNPVTIEAMYPRENTCRRIAACNGFKTYSDFSNFRFENEQVKISYPKREEIKGRADSTRAELDLAYRYITDIFKLAEGTVRGDYSREADFPNLNIVKIKALIRRIEGDRIIRPTEVDTSGIWTDIPNNGFSQGLAHYADPSLSWRIAQVLATTSWLKSSKDMREFQADVRAQVDTPHAKNILTEYKIIDHLLFFAVKGFGHRGTYGSDPKAFISGILMAATTNKLLSMNANQNATNNFNQTEQPRDPHWKLKKKAQKEAAKAAKRAIKSPYGEGDPQDPGFGGDKGKGKGAKGGGKDKGGGKGNSRARNWAYVQEVGKTIPSPNMLPKITAAEASTNGVPKAWVQPLNALMSQMTGWKGYDSQESMRCQICGYDHHKEKCMIRMAVAAFFVRVTGNKYNADEQFPTQFGQLKQAMCQ